MPRLICPTCKKPFDAQTSAALPFCSDRCRLVDLGRWLDEEQAIPVPRWDEDEEAEPNEGAG
jgi:endogenous inhibitor of DNA gyrase (YacG/DUF329 family)